ncbi:MAG: tetratricopeptide repeat protein [Flavobacteriaceae bacterium]|nr:tetratricopeptide repeat protein [Flavobacteriaceae bacterium]
MALQFKAYYLLIGFFFVASNHLFSQDQNIADSLYTIYQQNKLTGKDKMELLRNLSFNERKDLGLSLQISEELIEMAESQNDKTYIFHGYYQKGNTLLLSGDLNKALDAFFESSQAAIDQGHLSWEGMSYMAVADIYSEIGNSDNSELYYDKAIRLIRQTNDSINLATALLNAGDEYFNSKKFDLALRNFEESGRIFKAKNFAIGNAYNLGNIGMVYAEQGKDDLAKSNINEAISILEEVKDYYAISEYLTYMSDIYLNQNNWDTAESYAQRSLNLAYKYGLKKQIAESNLKLSELHEMKGNYKASHEYYTAHIKYRDSIINLENIQAMADVRTDYEVSQKQVEVDLLNEQKRNQRIIVIATAVALFLIGLLAIGLFRRNKFIKKTNAIIAEERDRSDKLLLNILPEETAQELKESGKVKAKKFDSATILFTDFKGFTHYAESLPPEEVVELVDFYFSKFDEIMETYKLEKIKTVGDAYMSAGGLHPPKEDHAIRMTLAAWDIIDFVNKQKLESPTHSVHFDIRIGINTGPLVAGVVGSKKFAYDIWGDSVNVASRMESNSEPGKINISEHTYNLIKDAFECEYRGELDMKNHGAMKMYFVNGIRENIRSSYVTEAKMKVV